jgi:hypothetical protein
LHAGLANVQWPACDHAVARCEQIDEVRVDLMRVRDVFNWYGLICSDQPTCVSDVWQRRHRFETQAPS